MLKGTIIKRIFIFLINAGFKERKREIKTNDAERGIEKEGNRGKEKEKQR